ncbi:endonuclease domain-containing protein [Chryseobacterium echinoideorum]|uniref:endonuclease domain-containing protein n=1 Tax=Chryseobacterium echinoideorum TaxID=1549648 RepID=UPI0021CF98B1|nr:endonuclease domain-containing protein [Chryseobacterium echinoideorum]
MSEKQIFIQIDGVIISRNFIENLSYNRLPKPLAKEKKLGVFSEVLFWKQVREIKVFTILILTDKELSVIILLIFYVKALSLVIEIDGISPDFKQEYDLQKTKFLESLDLKIFRIINFDMKHNLSVAMKNLENFIIKNYS